MKKLLTLFLAMTMIFTAAAGCGRRSEKLVVLLREQDDDAIEVYRGLTERYVKETGVEVELRTVGESEYENALSEAEANGEMPDIFCVTPGDAAVYAEEGLVLPLDEYLDSGAEEELWTALKDAYSFEDSSGEVKLYALPKSFSVDMLAFNKDIFDAAGEPYPKPGEPYTWNELLAVCQRLTRDTDRDGAIDQWGWAGGLPESLDSFVYTNGASYLNGDGTKVNIESAEFVEALQFFADLTCKYQVAPPEDTGLQCWLDGRAAFYPCGTDDVASFTDPDSFAYNWGFCGWPAGASGKSTAVIEASAFAVSNGTENPEGCVELITMLSTDPEGQRLLCGGTGGGAARIPNIRSYAEGEFSETIETGELRYGDNHEIIFSCLDRAERYDGVIPERDLISGGWRDEFLKCGYSKLLSGEVTAWEYCEKASSAMQSALDAAKGEQAK